MIRKTVLQLPFKLAALAAALSLLGACAAPMQKEEAAKGQDVVMVADEVHICKNPQLLYGARPFPTYKCADGTAYSPRRYIPNPINYALPPGYYGRGISGRVWVNGTLPPGVLILLPE